MTTLANILSNATPPRLGLAQRDPCNWLDDRCDEAQRVSIGVA